MGASGELVLEMKAKEIFVKVMRESPLEMAIKRQHDFLYTDHFHHTPSFSPCLDSLQLIDSPSIDWAVAVLQETLLLIMW